MAYLQGDITVQKKSDGSGGNLTVQRDVEIFGRLILHGEISGEFAPVPGAESGSALAPAVLVSRWFAPGEFPDARAVREALGNAGSESESESESGGYAGYVAYARPLELSDDGKGGLRYADPGPSEGADSEWTGCMVVVSPLDGAKPPRMKPGDTVWIALRNGRREIVAGPARIARTGWLPEGRWRSGETAPAYPDWDTAGQPSGEVFGVYVSLPDPQATVAGGRAIRALWDEDGARWVLLPDAPGLVFSGTVAAVVRTPAGNDPGGEGEGYEYLYSVLEDGGGWEYGGVRCPLAALEDPLAVGTPVVAAYSATAARWEIVSYRRPGERGGAAPAKAAQPGLNSRFPAPAHGRASGSSPSPTDSARGRSPSPSTTGAETPL